MSLAPQSLRLFLSQLCLSHSVYFPFILSKRASTMRSPFLNGANGRIRTDDRLFTKQMRYRCATLALVGQVGVEPTTSCI